MMNNSAQAQKSLEFMTERTPSKLLIRLKQQRFLLLMLLPTLIWYIIFKYLPMIGSYLAFTDSGLSANISFVGLDNFRRLFQSPGFWTSFGNTLIISAYYLIFYFPVPVILSLLLNEFRSVRFKRALQFTIYIPHFFSWAVVGSLFVMLLSPGSGPVNEIIKIFGGKPIFFMVSPDWFRSILVSSHLWKDVGYGTVIYIATLATIDPELYDAALVDGAGYWGRLWHITLPCLRSTIAVVLLLQVSNILRVFEQILVMYNPAVYQVSEVLQTYSFTEGLLNGDIGFATAIGLFTSITSLLLVFGTNSLSKKVMHESIL
ncbi:putative aldouronate transport system permease protein [Hydrogenispora ethanolica]|jgi:putative aldouronate transport system permease protein|uniref:Putative aldouronate transport system permease protein n=1 Tax=Hydrogenispora ethanolica TaxID=1082276 RepID=A0A4R1SB08_HYDET|nr:ABC transporter permease subunit [Hydrogenispora ethanolica]TCL76726.1 putative aldouronate transport system permease protein [Hydrogenispora ethanolica]